MKFHFNINKINRLKIAKILVILVMLIEIVYFSSLCGCNAVRLNNIVTFVISESILLMLLICLFLNKGKAIFVSYIVVKVLDGVCGPLVASYTFEELPKDTWYGLGKTISYIICSFALFLTIIFLIINEISHYHYAHSIIEILTLIAVISAFLTIIFTIIVVAKRDMEFYELFEPIYETLLFTSLFIISPLVHEGKKGEQDYEQRI